MTVSSTTNKSRTTGNGVTTVFPATIKIFAATDIKVTTINNTTDVVVNTLLLNDGGALGFTVAFDTEAETLSVTVNTAPTAAEDLQILRVLPQTQTSDFPRAGKFPAETNENALDKNTMILQDQQERLNRSLTFPETAAGALIAQLPVAPLDGFGLVWDGTTGTLRNTTDSLAVLEGNAAIVAADIDNVNTVAINIANVNAVGAISGDVTTVAGISANVTTVASISTNVTTVAGISADVTTVAGDTVNIGIVAGDSADIQILAPISTDITTVSGISANVTTVAGISANVTTVAVISTDVTTVAGISTDVTAVAADAVDIGVVATDITNVNTVATNIADVNTVATNIADVNTIVTNITDVNTVAANITDVNEAAEAIDSAFKFTFDVSTVMADPGIGDIRLNNVPASTTLIAIDDQTAQTGNPDVSAEIITWDDSTNTDKGTLRLNKGGDPTVFAIYTITSLTDNVGWTELAVTFVAGSGSFSAADNIFTSFSRAGDSGTSFQSTDITSQTDEVIVAADEIVFADTSDAGNLKKDTIQGILDLAAVPNASETVKGIVELATQAELEAETATGGTGASLVATPLSMKSHPGVAKAWVKGTSVTTTSISASHNVSSLTDHAVGDTSVNFTTAFSTANYAYSGMSGSAVSTNTFPSGPASQTTSAFRFTIRTATNTILDDQFSLIFFGDQ